MSTFLPSPYQAKVFDTYDNEVCHMLIRAVAGSGKSTTIVKLAERIPSDKRVLFLAFNREIMKELREKLKGFPHIEVKTLHSFGLNELRYYYRTFIKDREKMIDDGKISSIILSMSDAWGPFLNSEGLPDEAEKMSYCTRVERIANIARFALPQSREEMLQLCEKFDVMVTNGEIEKAKDVLRVANQMNDKFDYIDMIYRPVIGTWRLKQYDVVIIDECQDLNRAQQEMLRKVVKPNGGRMIAVGDPSQSIYGFTGADIDSYNRLKSLFPNVQELPLSICYRCDSSIIEHAKAIVPEIEARPTAPEGEVRQGSVSEIVPGDLVLCRNTRPLVSLCMQFIAKGQKAIIKGGDIGKNLIRIIRDTKAKSLQAMNNKFDRQYEKTVKNAKKANPFKDPEETSIVANLRDKIEAIRSVASGFSCKTPEDVMAAIESIFTDENTSGIVLSTMHKSKGLEANRVHIIERHLLPAAYARRPHELEQEHNLDYVARTRAKHGLYYVADWVSDADKKKDLAAALQDIPKNPNVKLGEIADQRDQALVKPKKARKQSKKQMS